MKPKTPTVGPWTLDVSGSYWYRAGSAGDAVRAYLDGGWLPPCGAGEGGTGNLESAKADADDWLRAQGHILPEDVP